MNKIFYGLVTLLVCTTGLTNARNLITHSMYFFINKNGVPCIIHNKNGDFRFTWNNRLLKKTADKKTVHISPMKELEGINPPDTTRIDSQLNLLEVDDGSVENVLKTGYEKLKNIDKIDLDLDTKTFFLEKFYSQEKNNITVFKEALQAYVREKNGKKIREYAQKIQYPLTIEKLNWIIDFAKQKSTQQILAQLESFHKEDARKIYTKEFCSRLQKIVNEKNSSVLLERLNKRYKHELDGGKWRAEDTFAESMLTLYNLRISLIYLLLGNTQAPLGFSSTKPGKKESWFWFRSEKENTKVPSRYVEQDILKLLAENNWDETVIKKEALDPLVQKIPAGWSWKKFMAHFYKIHLMPDPGHIDQVLEALCTLFAQNNMSRYFQTFKVNMRFVSIKSNKKQEATPVIVMYIYAPEKEDIYKKNAQLVLDWLGTVTKSEWGTGIQPRYNSRLNNLIFIAQGDGKQKKSHTSNLGAIFEKPDYALYRGDWVGDPTLDFGLIINN